MVKKAISLVLATEFVILATSLYSFELFINLQVAFLSSLFVILGSSFAYAKMVDSQVASETFEGKRDLLDELEDPHELYDDEAINEASADELDLRAIVKEERAKIKTFSVKGMKYGARGSASAFRLTGYLFLVLGFIALKNNELLNLAFYLPSLLVGIVIGSLSAKAFAPKT